MTRRKLPRPLASLCFALLMAGLTGCAAPVSLASTSSPSENARKVCTFEPGASHPPASVIFVDPFDAEGQAANNPDLHAQLPTECDGPLPGSDASGPAQQVMCRCADAETQRATMST